MSAAPKRNYGCLIGACILFILWIMGGWTLWKLTLNPPAASEDEEPYIFELIPSPTERSFIEEDEQPKKER